MPSELEIRSNIIALLRSGIGVGIEFFGLLSIDELKDGSYRVLSQEDENKDIEEGESHTFNDVKKAVDFFLELRKKRGLGFDLGDK